MHFFDAHCDTVMAALAAGRDIVGGDSHVAIDLPRLEAAGSRVQLFAVFTYPGDTPETGDLRAYADRAIATIRGWVEQAGDRMRLALTARDIRDAFADAPRPVYALLGLEGCDPLEGRSDDLRRYFDMGVRHIIPAWDDNSFSGAAQGGGGPLSEEGFRLIQLAQELRVMVDVSHASDAAFWQIADLARRPFVASHSDCRALSPAPRNLTDEMIRSLADHGGVMGVNFAPDFLDADYLRAWDAIAVPSKAAIKATTDPGVRHQIRSQTQPRLRALPRPDAVSSFLAQVHHAIQVGGEDCIGIGCDLDGLSILPDGMTGIESYPMLAEALVARGGLTPAQSEKVCWRNMARVFADVLPE